MPWMYTPLASPKYQPRIDAQIKANLSPLFMYNHFFKYLTEVIKNENKFLSIKHDGDTQLGYTCLSPVSYRTLTTQPIGSLQYYIDSTETNHLKEQYIKAQEYLISTDNETNIKGLEYDSTGNATGVIINSKKYDTPTENADLATLIAHGNKNYQVMNHDLIFRSDDTMSIKMNLTYPEAFARHTMTGTNFRTAKELYVTDVVKRGKISCQQVARVHLNAFGGELGILNDDHGEYIYSVFPDSRMITYDDGTYKGIVDFKLDLEFIFKDNVLVDVLLYRILYNNFQEIEKQLNAVLA